MQPICSTRLFGRIAHLKPPVVPGCVNQRATATVLVNANGKPWASSEVLSKAINRWMTRIGVRKPGVRAPTMHGLRHTGASDVSMLPGVGVKGIQGATGHASPAQAMHYAEQAERARIQEQTIAAWDALHEQEDAERAERARAKKRATLRVVR
jgi:integrase